MRFFNPFVSLRLGFFDEKLVNAFFNDWSQASKERARLSKAIGLEPHKALSIVVFILPEQLKSSREEDRLLYLSTDDSTGAALLMAVASIAVLWGQRR